ncbi:MAG: glycerol-3-phosphate 1-O-acyltransferase PlsY [Verrucomicrobiota bacterium]
MFAIIAAVVGYFLGAFPAGYFAGRIAGVDVRSEGSGNIGATNVLRVLGKRWGYTVFFIDTLKGFLAVQLTFLLANHSAVARGHAENFAVLAAVMCILGHTFPVWLRFKGGKGVATSAGAIAGLMPLAAAAVLVTWIVTYEIFRYVSLASIMAAAALPITVALLLRWEIIHGPVLFYFALAMTILVIWKHRSNFSRLLNGTEQRFARKR